jgi:hypothetical protein
MKKLFNLFLIPVTAGFLFGCASGSNSSFLDTVNDVGVALTQRIGNDEAARVASMGSQTRYNQIMTEQAIREQQQRNSISQQEKQNETTLQLPQTGITNNSAQITIICSADTFMIGGVRYESPHLKEDLHKLLGLPSSPSPAGDTWDSLGIRSFVKTGSTSCQTVEFIFRQPSWDIEPRTLYRGTFLVNGKQIDGNTSQKDLRNFGFTAGKPSSQFWNLDLGSFKVNIVLDEHLKHIEAVEINFIDSPVSAIAKNAPPPQNIKQGAVNGLSSEGSWSQLREGMTPKEARELLDPNNTLAGAWDWMEANNDIASILNSVGASSASTNIVDGKSYHLEFINGKLKTWQRK